MNIDMKALSKISSLDLSRSIDLRVLLESKGIKFIDRGKWLHMSCLFPDHNDNNPSFSIHTEHLGFNCFGCGREGTWEELCEELGWDIDYDKQSTIIGIRPQYVYDEAMEKIKKSKLDEKRFKIPSGFKLITNKNRKHYNYLRKRKLEKTIEFFKIGMTTEEDIEYGYNYINRIIIPVHNQVGKTIWCEGRYIGNKKKRKYFRPYGVNKSHYLFNFHRVQSDWVIVVEGIIDAMTLHLWSYPVVCCFGADLSREQLVQLMNFNTVYLCYDNDKAGINAIFGIGNKFGAKELLKGTGINIYRILLPRRRDANDLNRDQFEKYFIKAKQL